MVDLFGIRLRDFIRPNGRVAGGNGAGGNRNTIKLGSRRSASGLRDRGQ